MKHIDKDTFNKVHTATENLLLGNSKEAYIILNDIVNDEQLSLCGVSQQRELLEAYQDFIDWNEYHDRKGSTSKRIDAFLASNCG